MVPMMWEIFGLGIALLVIATLIFRWVKNKLIGEGTGWQKYLKFVLNVAFWAWVIWALVVWPFRYLTDPWERAAAIYKLQPAWTWGEVVWRDVLHIPETIEAAKEIPAQLPQFIILPPPPSAPTAAPTVTLEELRRRELPIIPLEIRSVTAAEITTFSATKIITEGIVGTLAPTQTITVQLFKDSTILVSSKTVTEMVQGWLRDVRFKAEAANDIDVTGQLHPRDPIRTELAQTMSQVRVVLEFSGVTNDPAAEYGVAFVETEKLVNRLQVLPVAAGKYKFDIHQAPRGADEGGTPQLQAYVSALRRQYYELSSRHRVLADQITLSKVKVDGKERKALLTDAQNLLWTVRDLKSKLTVEIEVNGTVYEASLLQWLNATELDLVALVTRI